MMGGKPNACSGKLIQAFRCLQERHTYFTSYNNAEPCYGSTAPSILGTIAARKQPLKSQMYLLWTFLLCTVVVCLTRKSIEY